MSQSKARRKQSGRRGSSGTSGDKVSSNWLALRKELGKSQQDINHGPIRQKSAQRSRPGKSTSKPEHAPMRTPEAVEPMPMTSNSVIDNMLKALNGGRLNTNLYAAAGPSNSNLELATKSSDVKHLRKMILGKLRYTEAEQNIGTYIAIDCEMVQVGDGREFSLARISIVNFFGHVVLDAYVKQTMPVTEYLTAISGIRPSDLKGPNAKSFEEVQKFVQELFKGRTIVGHSIQHDLDVLKLTHPSTHIRDTQLMTGKHPKLKTLVKQKLGINIQVGEHDSITDARAAMALFRIHKAETEQLKQQETSEWTGLTNESYPPTENDRKGPPTTSPNPPQTESETGPQARLSKSAFRALKKERIKAAGEVRETKVARSLRIKVKNRSDATPVVRKIAKPSLIKERSAHREEAAGDGERTRRTAGKWWSTL